MKLLEGEKSSASAACGKVPRRCIKGCGALNWNKRFTRIAGPAPLAGVAGGSAEMRDRPPLRPVALWTFNQQEESNGTFADCLG
jgi:hypothetical protein